jgi:hypothetical protein
MRAKAKLICVSVSAAICSGGYMSHALEDAWTAQPYRNRTYEMIRSLGQLFVYLVIPNTALRCCGLVVATGLLTRGVTIRLTSRPTELYRRRQVSYK